MRVVKAVEGLWFQQPGFADGASRTPVRDARRGDHLVAGFGEGQRGQNWLQTFVFGSGNKAAHRGRTPALEASFDRFDSDRQAMLDLVDRYLAAWAGEVPLASVYAENVVVRDDIAGSEWRGIDEVSAGWSDLCAGRSGTVADGVRGTGPASGDRLW